jgi:hypothetical protein
MDGWDIALLVAAAYVAVTGLVRLMLANRQRWLTELRAEAEAERRRQREAARAAQPSAGTKKAA